MKRRWVAIITPSCGVLTLCLLLTGGLKAQSVMQGSGPGGLVRIFNTDSATLESQEVRKDLPCTVTPIKPILGFDLRFHAGYEVSIPLRDLAGSEDMLTMVFRVTSESHKDEPVYMSQRLGVPTIAEVQSAERYSPAVSGCRIRIRPLDGTQTGDQRYRRHQFTRRCDEYRRGPGRRV